MNDDPVGDVTVTIYRGDEAITVALTRTKLGLPSHPDMGIISVVEALDEDGNAVRLSQWEEIQACQLARAGADETGR